MPTEKLTDTRIASLAVAGDARAQVDYWDTLARGLVLRVSRERKTWCVVYRLNGKKDRLTFGTYPILKLYDARQRAAEILRNVQQGIDPKAEKPVPSAVPLGEVVKQFRARAFPDLAASTQ